MFSNRLAAERTTVRLFILTLSLPPFLSSLSSPHPFSPSPLSSTHPPFPLLLTLSLLPLPPFPLPLPPLLSPPRSLLSSNLSTESPSLPHSPGGDAIDEFFGEKSAYGEDVNSSEDEDEDMVGQSEGSGLGISLDGDDDEVMSAYQKYRQLKSVLCQCHCLISDAVM